MIHESHEKAEAVPGKGTRLTESCPTCGSGSWVDPTDSTMAVCDNYPACDRSVMGDGWKAAGNSLVPYDPVFAAYQSGEHGNARFELRTFIWGDRVKVSTTLAMLRGNGGGPTRFADTKRGYQPQFTCTTCPFWGVDEYGQNSCAHPFYLDVVGCPQSNGSGRSRKQNLASADNECPMLGDRDWRLRRRFRVRVKAERFADYFGEDLDRLPGWVRNGFWAGIGLGSRMWARDESFAFHPTRLSEFEPFA